MNGEPGSGAPEQMALWPRKFRNWRGEAAENSSDVNRIRLKPETNFDVDGESGLKDPPQKSLFRLL